MAQEESKIRVAIFLNGDFASGGKALVFAPDASLETLLGKASGKLGVKAARCFLGDGSEVTDTDEVVDGDTLYFSDGADFLMPKEDVQVRLLDRLTKSVLRFSGDLYGSSSAFVKDRAPGVVATTLEKVESNVAPALAKAGSMGQPYVNWADEKLDGLLRDAKEGQDKFLSSSTGKSVQSLWNAQAVEAFYVVLVEQYSSLRQQSSSKLVDLTEFVDSVRVKIAASWSEKLMEPVSAFYKAVQQEVKDRAEQGSEVFVKAKEQLGETWEKSVASSLKLAALTDPAKTFYVNALDAYRALSTSGNGSVSFREFVIGMRVKLGELWKSGEGDLRKAAKQLYDSFVAAKSAEDKAAADAAAKGEGEAAAPAEKAE